MPDKIRLLPDAIANQIAAGEVIQRPASVVKELMENAVDAGASTIRVFVKDAGKTLISVVDDGCGMSETDARLSFARHATSKIRSTADLFAIRTMGFRGEALASIAAVAHVEMKTRREQDELGVRLELRDSKLVAQELCQASKGTSITVKNLFYNVPARRKFLKSDTVEFRHIVNEFLHVAMAHPELFFSLQHNDKEIYHLPQTNLRQRIVAILGKTYNERIVPVEEITDAISIRGFVGKPEYAQKKRRHQYFFVNKRFVRSAYLYHALRAAYDDLIPKETHPLFVLFIDIDPDRIDINVHPTKQEIKFEDEQIVYNYVRVVVRHALGKHHATPVLDFDEEPGLRFDQHQPPRVDVKSPKSGRTRTRAEDNWERMYADLEKAVPNPKPSPSLQFSAEPDNDILSGADTAHPGRMTLDASPTPSQTPGKPFQVHGKYIVHQIKSGLVFIHQRRAHKRILFEKYLRAFENGDVISQKSLFPETVTLPTDNAVLLKAMLPELFLLGFDIENTGHNEFLVRSIPAELLDAPITATLHSLIEQYQINLDLKLDHRENIARATAAGAAVKVGTALSETEMNNLINQLFACEFPATDPDGLRTYIKIKLEDLDRDFA